MTCGSLKNTKLALSVLCQSFNEKEGSIKKARRKENQGNKQGQESANHQTSSDPVMARQAPLLEVALEVDIQATVTVEGSEETILQEGLMVHQPICRFVALRQAPTGPQ